MTFLHEQSELVQVSCCNWVYTSKKHLPFQSRNTWLTRQSQQGWRCIYITGRHDGCVLMRCDLFIFLIRMSCWEYCCFYICENALHERDKATMYNCVMHSIHKGTLDGWLSMHWEEHIKIPLACNNHKKQLFPRTLVDVIFSLELWKDKSGGSNILF